ncbi:MAG: protein phosphatase 2C domain-containing protein [Actinomycetota bacterium]|nr:protein phosphatase 2C domain-containing protein [Actinomycetota bacterium]
MTLPAVDSGEDRRVGPARSLAPDERQASGHFAGGGFALMSVRGAVRELNEDRAVVMVPSSTGAAPPPLFVVADGLGGHQAGEVAAQLAVTTASQHFPQATGQARQALRAAFRQAALAVYDASFEPGRSGMATTLTAATMAGGELIVAHLGDSRCYLWRDGEVEQLTTDHSQVAEMVRLGLLTPEQAAHHPGRSILTRCLGTSPGPPPELVRRALRPRDRVLLCSDGLWGSVDRAEVAEALARRTPPAAADPGSLASRLVGVVSSLVERALRRGAPDNVTVVALEVEDGCPWLEGGPPARRRWLFGRG